MVRSDARGRLDLDEMRAERARASVRPRDGDYYRVFWENRGFSQFQNFTNEDAARRWRQMMDDRGRPARIVKVARSRRARAHTRSPPRRQ